MSALFRLSCIAGEVHRLGGAHCLRIWAACILLVLLPALEGRLAAPPPPAAFLAIAFLVTPPALYTLRLREGNVVAHIVAGLAVLHPPPA